MSNPSAPWAQPPAGPAASADAGSPEQPKAPVPAPVPGEVCRYSVFDAYADPARDRDQLVLVTGGPDGTGAVKGFVLGYAENVEASFRPEDLRPA